MININREERRRLPKSNETDKRVNKLKTWVKSWNLEQRRLFDKMVENEVGKIEKTTEIIVNDCYGAAINNFFEDMKAEEVNKILMNANDYMDEVQEFIKESKGEYWDMVENKELIKKAKARSLELMKARVIKSKALVMLKKEFKLPTKDLANIWTEVKEERGINISTTTLINGNEKMSTSEGSPKKEEKKHIDKEILKDIKEDIKRTGKEVAAGKEKIIDFNGVMISEKDLADAEEIVKYSAGEIKANLMMEGEHGFEIAQPKQEGDFIDIKDVTEGLEVVEAEFKPPVPSFKIKSIVLEGKSGNTYIKDDNGIKTEDKIYKDIEEVKKEKEMVAKSLKDEEIKIKKELDNLNKKLCNIKVKKEERNEQYAELEAVFDM